MVRLGRIGGAYGLHGWVHVRSATDGPERILDYSPWSIDRGGEWREFEVVSGRPHGPGLVAKLAGCDDRDCAQALAGSDIAVPRDRLPALDTDEYYWVDLIGLTVVTTRGLELGRVSRMLETGANDVLVVDGERERLIPYVPGEVVVAVDEREGEIRVDWDPEF